MGLFAVSYTHLDVYKRQASDGATEISFGEFLRLVNRVRFGKVSLTKEEHKKMARYAKAVGTHIYSGQKAGKKFLMKVILFYV